MLHAQLKLPPFGWQLPLGLQSLFAQTSIGAQTTPSPLKPGLHAQLKLPAVLVHVALAAQLSAF